MPLGSHKEENEQWSRRLRVTGMYGVVRKMQTQMETRELSQKVELLPFTRVERVIVTASFATLHKVKRTGCVVIDNIRDLNDAFSFFVPL